MDTIMVKDLVKNAYSKIAESYQVSYSEIDEQDWQHWDTFISACAGQKVLDMGCGTGDATRYLLKKGVFPCGIDFSDGMLKIAKMQDNAIIWIQGDVCNCPFPDHSFKGIVVSYTINHLNGEMLDRLKAEVDRLLVKNGLLLVVYHVGTDEEIRNDPLDDSVSIYYHYFQREYLDKLFYNYETVDFYQRKSVDSIELVNDKAMITYIKR